jgi:glucose-1-phosphate thymidylyltransferase
VNVEVIGLIPAAGLASRLAALPCSKEIFPIGYHAMGGIGDMKLRVASDFLLERMRIADINKAFFIIREGKWDIPEYFGDGSSVGVNLAYLMMNLPYGSPYTLDQAWPFVQEARIALGFPDIIFEPEDAYVKLLAHQQSTRADVVLGLFPSEQPYKMDMVETDISGNVQRILIKPQDTSLRYCWMIAVWNSNFTRFMHAYLEQQCHSSSKSLWSKSVREIYVGDVIKAAIKVGLRVESETFPSGHCIDLGTPEDLSRAMLDYGFLVRRKGRLNGQ